MHSEPIDSSCFGGGSEALSRSQTAGSGMPATSPLPTRACSHHQATSETWRYRLQQIKMATVFSSTFSRTPYVCICGSGSAPAKKETAVVDRGCEAKSSFLPASIFSHPGCPFLLLTRATCLPPARHLLARDTMSPWTGDPIHEVEGTLTIGHAEVATPHVLESGKRGNGSEDN